MNGVFVCDKPRGPTSHDLVAWARRALGTREVGHAGTLDPLASGVLVLLAGEATKLSPFLTADDKRYDAVISLGTETDTLDAAGRVVAEAPVPAIDEAAVTRALATFRGVTKQVAPVVSALKKDGVALHARARRGEAVEAPERDVVLHDAVVRAARGATIELSLHVGKGFYVRSLARDLAKALGTVGHLSALRRTASGAFGLEGALDADVLRDAARGDAAAKERVLAARIPLADAARRAMPVLTLDAAGVADARTGRRVRRDSPGRVALLDESGALVAVAEAAGDGTLRVVRGFVE